jgi:hypothetical protein
MLLRVPRLRSVPRLRGANCAASVTMAVTMATTDNRVPRPVACIAGRASAWSQVVVGAVIACHPAGKFGMCIGTADCLDLFHARRIDGELNDQSVR